MFLPAGRDGGDAQGAFGSSPQCPEGIREAQSMLAQLLEVENSPHPSGHNPSFKLSPSLGTSSPVSFIFATSPSSTNPSFPAGITRTENP